MTRALALVLLAACGAAKPSPSSAPAAQTGVEPATDGTRAEITQLDETIRAELARMGLPAPTPAMAPPAATPQEMGAGIAPPSTDATCKPAASQTCTDTCTLADSICKNAARICTLAGELGSDAWANGKCSDGKTSCDRSKERCCGCTL